MKKIIYTLSISLIVLLPIVSCSSDDDNNTSVNRGTEKIEVFIDGSSTPLSFSSNINAKDVPLAVSSGFINIFSITSENTNGDPFVFKFQPTNVSPFVLATPTTENLLGPITYRININGVNIDDSASNDIDINYNVFGSNPNDDIKIDFNGQYFDMSGLPHSISGEIDIKRD